MPNARLTTKMKKLTIAFLYNVRHKYPDPNDPRTFQEVDFDDPPTISWMIKHFQKCGYEVLPIEANEQAYLTLYQNQKNIDLAFNYAEGIHGLDREAQLPAMLEMLKIPYTGCRPLTCAIILNKARTKEILNNAGVPVLPSLVFKTGEEKIDHQLKFPLIVKPISEGSSMGITNKSVVNSREKLSQQIKWVIQTFKAPALVEPFLTGREFSVPMVGNPPKILPIIESDHASLPKKYQPLDSLEVKWHYEEEPGGLDHFICPANIPAKLAKKVIKICLKAWEVLEISDVCRIDIRCDKFNNPYVLEVNFPAGMIPPEVSKSSYLPLSARAAGIDYDQLLELIIDSAACRYGLH